MILKFEGKLEILKDKHITNLSIETILSVIFAHMVRKLFAKVLGRKISCLTAWRVPNSLGWPDLQGASKNRPFFRSKFVWLWFPIFALASLVNMTLFFPWKSFIWDMYPYKSYNMWSIVDFLSTQGPSGSLQAVQYYFFLLF